MMKMDIQTYGDYWQVSVKHEDKTELNEFINQLFNYGSISSQSIEQVDAFMVKGGYVATFSTTRKQFLHGLIVRELANLPQINYRRTCKGVRYSVKGYHACFATARFLRDCATVSKMDYQPERQRETFAFNGKEHDAFIQSRNDADYTEKPSLEMVSCLGTTEERQALELTEA